MPNQTLEQTRDSVLRYGESIGCELLNFIVRPTEIRYTRCPLATKSLWKAVLMPSRQIRSLPRILIGASRQFVSSVLNSPVVVSHESQAFYRGVNHA